MLRVELSSVRRSSVTLSASTQMLSMLWASSKTTMLRSSSSRDTIAATFGSSMYCAEQAHAQQAS
jgi:hypothetical protein